MILVYILYVTQIKLFQREGAAAEKAGVKDGKNDC